MYDQGIRFPEDLSEDDEDAPKFVDTHAGLNMDEDFAPPPSLPTQCKTGSLRQYQDRWEWMKYEVYIIRAEQLK